MKFTTPAVLLALFSAANGRFLDANNSPLTVAQTYGTTSLSSSMNCGQCIGLGYHYCINKAENTVTNSYVTGSSTQSCFAVGNNNAYFNNPLWSCSNAFADRVYAKYVCQVNTTPCGVAQSFNLDSTTQTINISGLQSGQSCFYKLSAACGAIAFLPDDTSKTEIEYVEFRSAWLNPSDPVLESGLSTSKGSNDVAKRSSSPAANMPRRGQYFNSELGGNNIANANITDYTTAANNGTIWGRSGRYDEIAGGRKVYGNPTQGASQLGNVTDMTQPNCTTRNVYLAVTAVGGDATLKIALNTVDFYNTTDDGSGASALSMTLAAVFGLVSLAFF